MGKTEVHELLGAHFYFEGPLVQAIVGTSPHALWPLGKSGSHPGFTSELPPDLVGPPESAIQFTFALAGVSQSIAVAAQEKATRRKKLCDTSSAYPRIHHARAYEKGPASTVAAPNVDNTNVLRNVRPIATAAASHTVIEIQAIAFGS
jgi:hypothetical protein